MIAAICDDDNLFRKKLRDFLIGYKGTRRLHLDIVEFSNGKELLEYEYPCDIVFMDYEMPIYDGMETARMLRAKKNFCCIIFVTSYPEHVFEAFEVNTYRYLVKPIELEKLGRILDGYIKEKKLLNPITLIVDGEQLTVNSEDVLYLEADGSYCYIRTAKEFLHCSKTLSNVIDMLPAHCFFRTHKSYAINLHSVLSFKDNTISLTNGEKILVSRDRSSNFRKAYKDFIKYFALNG